MVSGGILALAEWSIWSGVVSGGILALAEWSIWSGGILALAERSIWEDANIGVNCRRTSVGAYNGYFTTLSWEHIS